MNEYILWFRRLQKREQNMLLLTVAFLLLIILYLLLWEPVFSALEQETKKNQSQKKTLLWMRDAESQVNVIRSQNNFVLPQHASQPISSLVETSATSTGIRSSITKMDSDKKKALKVQFKSVDFDRLTQWLGKLQNEYAITPKNLTINKTDETGRVSCQVTLEKSSI